VVGCRLSRKAANLRSSADSEIPVVRTSLVADDAAAVARPPKSPPRDRGRAIIIIIIIAIRRYGMCFNVMCSDAPSGHDAEGEGEGSGKIWPSCEVQGGQAWDIKSGPDVVMRIILQHRPLAN
jgi:hypothetical protein